jgi:hypothetical protein
LDAIAATLLQLYPSSNVTVTVAILLIAVFIIVTIPR